ncbi:MAG: glycosyltransferase family 39 protein [Chloroflexi bacterium]|nr:glycosyltransferase family 39 protein [Chloroflexota bacterium]
MQRTQTLAANLSTVRARRVKSGAIARSDVLVGVLLIGIMLIGGTFRFMGLNWDDFTHLHPDERFLTDVAQGLGRNLNPSGDELKRQEQVEMCRERYPETDGKGSYFDAFCSPLNPLNANSAHGLYVYGTLPLFIARGAADVYGQLWDSLYPSPTGESAAWYWTSYDGVNLVWRIMSALSEMACIVFAFLIGMRLHDKWVGLLAAFLYAATVFSIQIGHFGTVDALANLFATLTVFTAVEIQRSGRFSNYLLFGIAFGCALASRINLLPMFGLGIVAAAVRAFPVLLSRAPVRERDGAVSAHVFGLVAAGIVAVLFFRVFNPYAFDGPGFLDVVNLQGDFPFLTLHDRWLENMGTAQALVAGSIDSPPNFQWLGRTPYLYALNNMVLWGMGAPLGIAAWAALFWGLWRIVRGKPGALANIVLIVWVSGYFGYLGRGWVASMRYFLPLYPTLVVLAAWGLVSLWRWVARKRSEARWSPIAAGLLRVLVIFVPAFTLLWAAMFTNVYRHQLTRVQASHWVHEQLPGDFAMRVDGAPEGTPIINLNIWHTDSDAPLETRVSRLQSPITPRVAVEVTMPATGTLSEIYAPHLGDPLDDPEPETLRFTLRQLPLGATVIDFQWSSDLPRDQHPIGNAYTIPIPNPVTVNEGESYEWAVELVGEDDVISGGSIFTWEGAWDDPVPTGVCAYPEGITQADDPPPGLIWDGRDCRRISPWNDQINGYKPDLVYEDEPTKRIIMLEMLQYSDYIVISSNRFYDQLARNPQRWPMTTLYYKKLFAGELGYEIAAQFDETFELGPLRVSDQYLPTYDSPEWPQEFEVEESFHVYDHPAVFIFRKTADYNHDAVLDILYSVPLDRVYNAPVYRNCPGTEKYFCDPTLVAVHTLSSEEAAKAPSRLMLTDETRETQYSGGTWSDRFDAGSILNTEPVVTVAIWWLAVMIFGWVTFPALFSLLPGLALRGYTFAKFAGMFLIGWGLWVLASVRIPVWSQIGVAGGLAVMAVISVALVWRRRAEFGGYVRANWRKLLIVEAITLTAFLIFLGVRLSNPDLWHPSFGGEKPMDFAYFNAVLRSTIFPPYDPWHSGGFLNYYYFGFVIVGTPVLLLKTVPSIAFNLIIPTLFALTGIAAFGVAHDLVAATRRLADRWQIKASPMLAGIAALLLAIVLGNLDTPRVFLTGVARMGGYSAPEGYERYVFDLYVEETGHQPDDIAMLELMQRAQDPSIVDSLRYEFNNAYRLAVSLVGGAGQLLNGQQLAVGAERWFWGPSRVLAETPGVEGQAITEMPIFTFVYGDLHAHMISMPMQLMIVGLLLNEVLIAGRRRRRAEGAEVERGAAVRSRSLSVLTVALIGITVGMLRATNTWDWITYLLLGGVGLALAWWLAQGIRITTAGGAPTAIFARFTRQSLLSFVGSVGGYVAISFAAVLPFTTWYASTYNSIKPWTDGKTPLWAYFDINGLFLFLVVSLLIWETARWLRSVSVRALRGRFFWLLAAVMSAIGVLVIAAILSLRDYQVTLIALPLIVWAGVLILRPGQGRPMQFVLVLIGLALGLTLGVEYIVLDGDIGRQNTVFKFYLQAWLLLSAVGGAIFAWMMASMRNWSGSVRGVWGTLCAVLVFVAALFPVMAARGKSVFRFDNDQPLTLDGAAYMLTASQWEGDPEVLALYPERAPFKLDEDYRLIRWMQENLPGNPVIIEGLGNDTQYRWNVRVSIYTGFPAVLGWNFHQRQQRTLEPMGRLVEMRNSNINAFYHTDSIGTAWEMIRFYDVEYIVVGRMERAYYRDEGLAKFEEMTRLGLLEVVYQDGETLLYHVVPDAELREFG